MALFFLALFLITGLAAGELRVVPASEISAKIQKGEPIDYSYVEVKGDLDLSGLNASYSRNISPMIRIDDSIISGSVKLENTVLNTSIEFERNKFMGTASFIENRFKKPVNFDNSLFENNAYFYASTFDDKTRFVNTKFNKSVDFGGAEFDGIVFFMNCQYNGMTDFGFANFAQDVFFDAAIFFSRVSFYQAHFSNARFAGVDFRGNTDFSSAIFSGSANFVGAIFDKKLYLSKIKFGSLSISWDDISHGLDCDGSTYLLLVKNFKDREEFDDADNCYYQYRDHERQDKPFGWGKISDYISWISCGYGVRWQYTILSAIAVVTLFGIYYEFCSFRIIIIKFLYKQEPKNRCKYGFSHGFIKSLSFSAMTLLSLPADWSRSGKDEYAKFVMHHWFSSILERLIGWGLMLLLIGTISRVMVRY